MDGGARVHCRVRRFQRAHRHEGVDGSDGWAVVIVDVNGNDGDYGGAHIDRDHLGAGVRSG